MFFLQAMQAPVTVVIGGEILEIPKFTVGDFSKWAGELQQEFSDKATAHIADAEVKVQMLAVYPVFPPTRQDLRRMAMTDDGMCRIARECLPRAKVYEAVPVTGTRKTKNEKGVETDEDYVVRYDKGRELAPKTKAWIETVIVANSGRLGHLVSVLADLQDNSMVLPPAVARAAGDGEGKPADPLP